MSRRDRPRVDRRGRGPLGKIHVICDAESHAPKVAKIGRLDLVSDWGRLIDGEVVVSGVDTEFLVDDEVTDGRELFHKGMSVNRQSHRTRHRLECDLCGLRVDLRHEKAREIAERLDMARVSHVSLSGLAAILR